MLEVEPIGHRGPTTSGSGWNAVTISAFQGSKVGESDKPDGSWKWVAEGAE